MGDHMLDSLEITIRTIVPNLFKIALMAVQLKEIVSEGNERDIEIHNPTQKIRIDRAS
jgi:hypothetical protein